MHFLCQTLCQILCQTLFLTLLRLSVVLFGVIPVLAVASTGEGVEAFRKGDYEKAAEEFANAEEKSPNDLRVIFNRGAALAASGKFEEAVQTLRKSAIAKDTAIASKSLTLLGRLAVDRAKQLLNEKPEETPPEQRQNVLQQLLAAEKYYAESLTVEPSETVRMNLEQIRAWKNKIQKEWESVDRSQKRSDDIAKRLQWFEDWEGTINNSIRQTNEIPDSPKKFQTLYETAREQNKLTEEISVLQNDLLETLQQPPQQKTPNDEISEQEHQKIEAIIQELKRINDLTGNVDELLRQFQSEKALEVADETANRLNRLRLNLSPFEVIVQEAEKKQQKLCTNNPANINEQTETQDIAEQTREEQLIADWMPLMIFRAKHGLQDIESGRLATDQSQPEKMNALRESMNLAVQYGQEIQTLAEESSQLLAENKPDEAFPKQNQALKLLREILKPLQNQQQQDQQNQQNQQQNQQQQNQQQGQQNKEQEQNQKQQQEQKQQGQDQKQEQGQEQNQEQQQQNDKKPEQSDKQNPLEPNQEQPKKDLTSQTKNEEIEKAERMLRQVKRRQQEANEKRERVRTLLLQAIPVEKDW
ncbi:MAG: hypothetical protein LBL62_09725 [Planctomycetaceae bacterium]|jgi:hypothetical protein|nr:hypothetical protein [Planctomycetaceae bacterium]